MMACTMRITVRQLEYGPVQTHVVEVGRGGEVVVPPSGSGQEKLKLSGAIDKQGRLSRCCVCGCEELFVRKDFPQRFGLVMVVVAGLASIVLFYMRRIFLAISVLAGLVVVDVILHLLVKRCVVCYRCRTEYRDLSVDRQFRPWDLATGEKYRRWTAPADDP